MIKDLEFEDFIEVYEEDIYCAYMESGAYYDTDQEIFEEQEYEEYLAGTGMWRGEVSYANLNLDKPIKV